MAFEPGLAATLRTGPHERLLVVTADDEALARLAAADLLVGELDAPVMYLEGGNGGWTAAGHSMTAANPVFLDDPDDVRVRVNEAEGGMEKAMNDYLTLGDRAWSAMSPATAPRHGFAWTTGADFPASIGGRRTTSGLIRPSGRASNGETSDEGLARDSGRGREALRTIPG